MKYQSLVATKAIQRITFKTTSSLQNYDTLPLSFGSFKKLPKHSAGLFGSMAVKSKWKIWQTLNISHKSAQFF